MVVEKFGKQALLDSLLPEQVNRLSDAAEVVRLSAGKMIYQKGEPARHCFVILRGQVALRLPGKQGLSMLIDELVEGEMFGGCLSPDLDAYLLNAQCVQDSELLRIATSSLREIMDEDPRLGYAVQSKISRIYFKRYVETMEKLQSIVMNVPVESA
jgi:CRP-like cAMP-binding protein